MFLYIIDSRIRLVRKFADSLCRDWSEQHPMLGCLNLEDTCPSIGSHC